MRPWLAWACAALAAAGCAARRPAEPASSIPTGDAKELAAAIDADAKRSDRESDSKVRAELAADAGRAAAACLAREPQSAACLYGRGIALGLEARAHPARAGELLSAMLGSLESADAADPNYEEAGPARVRSLVLLRAPGWPLGPGDAEAGLAAARRAAGLRPQFPPNLLALAEASAKTGDANGARENYQRARDLAQALPAGTSDRDEWIREANEALKRH